MKTRLLSLITEYKILPAVALLSLSGCATLFPIKTKVKVDTGDGIQFAYSSAKDIEAKKTVLDADGNIIEILEIRSNASDPAIAQAEREKAQSEVLSKALEVINNKTP